MIRFIWLLIILNSHGSELLKLTTASDEASQKISKKIAGQYIENSLNNLSRKEIINSKDIPINHKRACLMEISQFSFCHKNYAWIDSIKAVAIMGVEGNNVGFFILNDEISEFIHLKNSDADYLQGSIEIFGEIFHLRKNHFTYSLAFGAEGIKKQNSSSMNKNTDFKTEKVERKSIMNLSKIKRINSYIDQAIDCGMSNITESLSVFRDEMRKTNLNDFDTVGYKHYSSFLRCNEILKNSKNKEFNLKLKQIHKDFKNYIIHPNSF